MQPDLLCLCMVLKVHKDKRWEMTHDLNHYNKPPMKRTLEEIRSLSKKKSGNYCSDHEPSLGVLHKV